MLLQIALFFHILASMFWIGGMLFFRELCTIEQVVVYTIEKSVGVVFGDSTII